MAQDNKDKQETKAGGLAAMLAKKAEEPNAVHTPPSAPPLTDAVNRTEPPIEIEAKLPDDPSTPEHAFRVFNHRYEFKIKERILKPDAKNIYTPTNGEEFDFLRLQVERGNIHFY